MLIASLNKYIICVLGNRVLVKSVKSSVSKPLKSFTSSFVFWPLIPEILRDIFASHNICILVSFKAFLPFSVWN